MKCHISFDCLFRIRFELSISVNLFPQASTTGFHGMDANFFSFNLLFKAIEKVRNINISIFFLKRVFIKFFYTHINTNWRVKGKKKYHSPNISPFSVSVSLLLFFLFRFSSPLQKNIFLLQIFPSFSLSLFHLFRQKSILLSPLWIITFYWLFCQRLCVALFMKRYRRFLSSLALCLLTMSFNRFRGVGNIFSFPHMTSFFLSSLALCLLAMSFNRFQGVGNISSFPPSDLFLVVLLGSFLSSLVIQKVSSCWEYF